jgi:hypothetical protein
MAELIRWISTGERYRRPEHRVFYIWLPIDTLQTIPSADYVPWRFPGLTSRFVD